MSDPWVFRKSFATGGYDHFGDIDHYDGWIYVPVNGGDVALVAVLDAADLMYLCSTTLR